MLWGSSVNVIISLIQGLSYEGLQSLLGIIHPGATILEALTQSKLALLSSSMLQSQPNAKQ